MSTSKKKPTSGATSPWLNQPSDAMSLHSNATAAAITAPLDSNYQDTSHPNYDSDSDSSLSYVATDDPPPLYTDDPSTAPSTSSAAAAAAAATNPLLPSSAAAHAMHAPVPTRTDADGNETYLDRRLDSDSVYLEHTIAHLALFPPRPYVRVVGTHTETSSTPTTDYHHHHNNNNNSHNSTHIRTESRTVTDFDVRVDLTPFLYRNIHRQHAWRTLRTAGNFDKVRRGTVFATRAPGYGGSSSTTTTASASAEDGIPSLGDWCRRYCSSRRRLKTLLIRRRVTGLDEDLLRTKLTALVRATQYRGHLAISFPLHGSRVEVRSAVWENRWRAVPWLRWLFYLSFLWIFTWPYLVLRTLVFDTVSVDWAFSRPADPGLRAADDPARPPRPGVEREFVTLSEEAWYNMWARAVQRAVLDRRQAELDQGDLRAAEAAEPTFADALGGGAVGGGGGGTADAVVRAGLGAMNVVNRQFGWGHNR